MKVTERQAKRAAAAQYDEYPNAEATRRSSMQSALYEVTNVPTTAALKAVVTVEELRDALKDRMHELNWMRKKHGEIEKEAQQTDE